MEAAMNTPATRPTGRITGGSGRRTLAFVTASGNVVTPRDGERVSLDDIRRMVDFVWVFDTTGSMYSKLESLKRCMRGFVGDADALKLDWRFSLVPFGDLTVHGDKVVGQLPFVTTVAEACRMIRGAERFSGGANEGESSLEALVAGMDKPFRQGAVKIIILVTDEPPLEEGLTTRVVNGRLRQGEFICFAATPAKCGFEPLARDNGGMWYHIGPRLDTADLLAYLRKLLKQATEVTNEVHRLGGGSVARYLEHPARRALT
jgi:hypothetical protein